jgi:hypothetical protein
MMYKSYNTITPIYEVWRGASVVKTLNSTGDGVVRMDSDSDLKMSFAGTFYEYSGVNFLTDRLRVSVEINGTVYPLGTYCVTTETPSIADGVKTIKVEAYSLLWLLNQAKIETLKYFPAEQNYISAVQGLISAGGIADYSAEASTEVLATDREDWEIGTSYLTIINELLSEINYNQVWVTNSGAVKITKYAAPSLSNIKHSYVEGRDSIIKDTYTLTNDVYDKGNVFIAICDNPEISETMRAVAINNNTNSPYSVANLGRRVPIIERVNNTPSQTELQAYANKMRDKSLQTNETIEFETAIVPTHEAYETVQIAVGGVIGIYLEKSWEISLAQGGTMRHRGVRIIE